MVRGTVENQIKGIAKKLVHTYILYSHKIVYSYRKNLYVVSKESFLRYRWQYINFAGRRSDKSSGHCHSKTTDDIITSNDNSDHRSSNGYFRS